MAVWKPEYDLVDKSHTHQAIILCTGRMRELYILVRVWRDHTTWHAQTYTYTDVHMYDVRTRTPIYVQQPVYVEWLELHTNIDEVGDTSGGTARGSALRSSGADYKVVNHLC